MVSAGKDDGALCFKILHGFIESLLAGKIAFCFPVKDFNGFLVTWDGKLLLNFPGFKEIPGGFMTNCFLVRGSDGIIGIGGDDGVICIDFRTGFAAQKKQEVESFRGVGSGGTD